MRIFIDEAGRFISGDGISLASALTIPHRSVGPCRRELLRFSHDWPRRDGELKSAELDAKHLSTLVDVLHRHDALLHVVATDAAKDQASVARHQAEQALGITKYLTNQHHQSLIDSVWELRRSLEKMPAQLYIQCVVMLQLAWIVAEEASMYFAQRRPRELAQFEWVIDAKDPSRITSQENWWRDVIGPMGEAMSRRKPFAFVDDEGFNYKYFDRAFSMEKDMWSPDGSRKSVDGFNIKKLITDNVSFVDSRSELFIQATDILAGFMRRALKGQNAEPAVLKTLGRLMIRKKKQTVRLIALGNGGDVEEALGARIKVIASSGRGLLKPERT
ncbi:MULTISPECIES: DUF3800 domain-containing protein [Bradyrhizobium]|uniref:DUF3800 domain-containing protein n=1 Tax=Bradyrhizobium elkanii TaxID=29448 RepID=UPI000489EE86|nr:DUF3800 domain-containing protein [Bradyrhizobium elkanii]